MTKKILLGLTLMFILIVPTTSLSAHAETAPQAPGDSDTYNYNAGGSTFAFPIIDKWRVEYNSIYPGITLNYQAIGSGAGIKLYTAKKVDFAGTDAPLQTSDIKNAPKGTLTIPESIGAIVIAYNLPQLPKNGLKLTGQMIADMYLGKIAYWNDASIKKLNPSIADQLPGNRIILVHRSDGSGTTFAFTSFLSQVSPAWANRIGHGTSVPWITGMGGPGNAGVAAIVKKVPYSMGYIEIAYAKSNKMQSGIPMTYAFLQNRDQTAFLDATVDTTAAAASGAISSLPKADGVWSKVSINDSPGDNAYPLASFTYLLVNPNLEQLKGMNQQKAQDFVHMLYWFITTGQQYAPKLKYVPLPDSVVQLDKQGLSEIKFNGQQIWQYSP